MDRSSTPFPRPTWPTLNGLWLAAVKGPHHAGHARLPAIPDLEQGGSVVAPAASRVWPAPSAWKKAKPFANRRPKSHRAAETIELSAEEAKRLAAKCCRSTVPATGPASWGSRSECRAAWWWRSRRSTFRSTSSATGRPGAGGRQRRDSQAGQRHAAVASALVEILLEAGLPPLAISCLTGAGGALGESSAPIRACAKSASPAAATWASKSAELAGIKRVTMELGSNSPLIVMDDADSKWPPRHRRHRLRQRRAGLHFDPARPRRPRRSTAICSTP